MTTVSVFGGTGFLGRRLVRRLVAEGAAVRVAVRHPDEARSALRAAGLERVTVVGAEPLAGPTSSPPPRYTQCASWS